jgi:serine/threonine protein kinase
MFFAAEKAFVFAAHGNRAAWPFSLRLMPSFVGLKRRVLGLHREAPAIEAAVPHDAPAFAAGLQRVHGHTVSQVHLPDRKPDILEVSRTRRDQLTDTLGRTYGLGERLGQGAFGDVRLLRADATDQAYAAKILRSPRALAMAREEAEAARIGRSPLTPDRILHTQDTAFLLLPLMPADFGAVSEVLQPLEPPEREQALLSFAEQLLRQTHILHARGLVHQDIKPENILRCGTNLFLSDFGCAKSVGYLKDHPEAVVGTALYAAPEVFTRKKVDDHAPATDVWADAMVLLCCLGPHPFSQFDTLGEALRAWKIWHLTGVRVRALGPVLETLESLSKPVRRLLVDMLHPKASRRLTAYEALRRVEKLQGENSEAHDVLAPLFEPLDSARGAQLGAALVVRPPLFGGGKDLLPGVKITPRWGLGSWFALASVAVLAAALYSVWSAAFRTK